MKTLCFLFFCLASLVRAAPVQGAEDFLKYRSFSLGATLPAVLKQTEKKMADVKVVHERPALIQELSWWPPAIRGGDQGDSVEQVLFSFYNGELYKIFVIYDRSAVKGFTIEDMVQFVSAKYGPPMNSTLEQTQPSKELPYSTSQILASWEGTHSSVRLIRAFSYDFGLVIFSKSLNAQAEFAISEAVKLEEQERPQRDAERQKKEANELEMARQRNRKVFQP